MRLLDNLLKILEAYYVNRDLDALLEARREIDRELDSPFLQEGTVSLNTMITEEAEALLEKEGCLVLRASEWKIAEIMAGKEVRVLPADQQKNGCLVLYVSHCSLDFLVLTQVGAG